MEPHGQSPWYLIFLAESADLSGDLSSVALAKEEAQAKSEDLSTCPPKPIRAKDGRRIKAGPAEFRMLMKNNGRPWF
jgi:hypothetical protein